jgi:hypothetical protein
MKSLWPSPAVALPFLSLFERMSWCSPSIRIKENALDGKGFQERGLSGR